MKNLTAEIVAIGDEMIGGGRLDTNTQWLARQLTEIGVQVAFHATVGDDFSRQADVFRIAASRADLVVVTGGLGPTKDDLTRAVLAEVVGVPLKEDPESLNRIRSIFERYGREMPESNTVQAMFPVGSIPIPNKEGTAPGIDCIFQSAGRRTRFFCLPGVPAEMFELWNSYVRQQICHEIGGPQLIETEVINCFGAGESHTESLLGDLIARGRDPIVGITASQAIISLRIVAKGNTHDECRSKIDPVIQFIHERLGDLVFGVGHETLEDVVVRALAQRNETIVLVDRGLNGQVGSKLSRADQEHALKYGNAPVLCASHCFPPEMESHPNQLEADLVEAKKRTGAIWGVAISSIRPSPNEKHDRFFLLVDGANGFQRIELTHAGHSSMRHNRSVNQVLNSFRLILLRR